MIFYLLFDDWNFMLWFDTNMMQTRFWSVVFQGLSKYTIIAKVLFQKCNEFNMLNCSMKSTPCVVVKKFRFSELKIEKVIFFTKSPTKIFNQHF